MAKKTTTKVLSKEEMIASWTTAPFSETIRGEAKIALEDFKSGKTNTEVEAYTIPLEFGTGGIRGVIGNGVGRMNDYTVGRAALGYSKYLVSKTKKAFIVIAYDSRRKSKEFAEVTAGIAASLGIKVKIFPIVAPTPMLSYAIRHYKATGGIVITASHNPPEYNGFKAYLADGGQLVPPDDALIIKSINDIQDWNEIKFLKKSDVNYKKNVSAVESIVFEAYKKKVLSSLIYNKDLNPKERANIKVVYSPLHGTGGSFMKDLLKTAGYKKLIMVKEQEKPNGEFPTVKYPNPEEKDALALCIKTSIENKADIFIATDPDADRMGIGIRNSAGEYELLNGNQTGSIMCAYLAEKHGGKNAKFDYHIFKTIVTTDLQKSIAISNKIKIKDVLTGFKYIANEMATLDSSKTKKFLFGGEESYGYLPVEFVRDKDSLSSTLLILEILADKKDLLRYLDEIYLKYGLYLEGLKSLTLPGAAGQQKIKDSLEKLRNNNLIGQKIGNRTIVSFIDYKNKKVSGAAKKSLFSGMPASDVIQVELDPIGKLTIRPSGTEPKVKIYASYQSSIKQPTSVAELEELKSHLKKEIDSSISAFIDLAGLNG